jgi:hypothetical protein
VSAKGNESVEDAYERRLKESQKVEERVEVVFSEQDIQQAFDEVCVVLLMSFSHQGNFFLAVGREVCDWRC